MQKNISFNPFQIDLPITDCISEIRDVLGVDNTIIVNAPAGAGKSTLLPLALMNESWLNGKKILMLEPRRLSAKTIAMRIASLINESVGDRIGYRIRFDNCIGKNTQVEIITEGILTRMIQSDNALENVGLVIFDEFHERSLYADVALALCRESQQVLRPDLRIMVMSATLNMPELTTLLNAKSVVSKGRQYPVEIVYSGERDLQLLPELTARLVIKACGETEGDILVFLPGEGEIRECEDILKTKLKQVQIHPLYGLLPPNQQFAAIMPNKFGKRKVVLATSIAETSLTIEGVRVVIDSGFSRTMKFDASSGLSRLETIDVTCDSADQRAGRAGRLSPGKCYRMWSKATHNRLRPHRVPEIEEADLTSLVLDMAQWGISNIYSLAWMSPPPKTSIEKASDLLHQLEALSDHKITKHGKEIHLLPCHPRLAHMLIMAKLDGLAPLATDVAALLEERDPLDKLVGVDINLRIEALRRFRSGTIVNKKLIRIEKIANQYRQLLKVEADNTFVNPFETGLMIVHAYPERIAHAKPGNNAQFKMANGNIASIGHKDDLAHEAWLAVAHINARENMGKIFLASPINPKDLMPLVKEKEVIEWDTKKGGFLAFKNLCIGNLILQSKPMDLVSSELKVEAIAKVIAKEGEGLLNFDADFEQWQNRVLTMRTWYPNDNWPDVSTPQLLATNRDWLAPFLNNVKKPDDLKRINILELLHYLLEPKKQNQLNTLAPDKIKVPSGSNIKLLYRPTGEIPVLAVRLQEVFGLLETPFVNDGLQPVLMHLLSPGYKLVQITSDLKSFWANAYFDVKKELKARYPKHEWPSNPLEALPIRGVKRKDT